MSLLTLGAVLAGFLMDCALGDPEGLPHPVGGMGRLISRLEKLLRRLLSKTPGGELAAGAVLAVLVPLASAGAAAGVLWLCRRASPWLAFAVSAVMCWQCFAARCLHREAERVAACLETEGLEAGRRQVSRLVGRDTERLTEPQVLRAAVETVAENTTDGVVAPLLWMAVFGPAGGFFYKAVNTMDSMVGYKNERYLYFGRAAARLDDAANFIPARIAALGMIAAAALTGSDPKNAARVWRRDRRNHASPNSAQTESACAGALHIQLGGSASYFGKPVEKPTLGDPDREIERADVARSCRLMYGDSILLLALCLGLGLLILFSGG